MTKKERERERERVMSQVKLMSQNFVIIPVVDGSSVIMIV